jgi:putative heme-binding domain-containing protein
VPTRLETQILHRVDEEWRAYNYVWNEEQTDALLQDDKAVDRTLLISDQTASGGRKSIAWHHASRSECLLCHIWSAGTVHGFLPEQLDMRWPAQDPPQQDRSVQEVSQVARLANLGLFRKPLPAVKRLANPHDINEPLEARARSYLAVNCSTCHRPLGGGTANFDFELTRSLSENNFLDALPAQGTFSIPDARVVARGAPVRSVLLYRMLKSGRGHMPQFGSSLTDRKGVSLISDWIASLDSSDFSHSPGIDVPSWQEAVADLQHTADLEQTIATHLRTTSGAIALSLICNLGVIADQTRAKIVEMGAATTDPVIRDLFEHFLPEDQRVKRLGTSFDEAALLALPGSVEQGERLFATSAEITCRQCHRIGQVGNAVGPDLDGVGLQMTSAELLASILHPSEKVDPRYRGRVILTTDGQIITGIVASESQQAITLIDSTGKPQIIPMESIEQMQSGTKSIMPELLFSGLTERQAADLLAFLSEQKRPGPLHHKQAQIPRIHQPLNIDGKLDEPAWARAPSLGDFVFTWWTDGDLPQQQTDARLLWDENYLYVSFKCWDRDVRATRELRDSDVYRDDCVEIFASPEIDHPTHYFNLEMNARGVQLDNYRPAGQEPANAWNPDGIQIAVQIDGTLNQSDDEDRSWTLEAAIPFKLFAHVLPDGHPRNGERWRLNLNRLEGEMAQKSQWSQGDRNIPRFHTPDLFGFVQFVGADTQISSPYSSVDPVRQAGEPKLLRSGFTFTEGPVWIASQQALLFSDVRENVTWRYRSPDIFDRYIENTGGGNGLAITPEHELIMCQVESRQLAKLQLPLSPEGVPPTLTSLTSLFDGREAGLGAGKYNQTNDAIARSDGTIYFTDPAYRPHTRELDFTGVYRLTPEGKVVLVSKDYYPNGIALSPDERWLYIVNRNHIERLQLAEDGSAMQAETLLETTSDGDGMAVDDAGNLYIATTAIEVFSASGKPYGAIKLPGSGLTNCTFGGPHRKTLFATTADSLTAIEMPIPGLP